MTEKCQNPAEILDRMIATSEKLQARVPITAAELKTQWLEFVASITANGYPVDVMEDFPPPYERYFKTEMPEVVQRTVNMLQKHKEDKTTIPISNPVALSETLTLLHGNWKAWCKFWIGMCITTAILKVSQTSEYGPREPDFQSFLDLYNALFYIWSTTQALTNPTISSQP